MAPEIVDSGHIFEELSSCIVANYLSHVKKSWRTAVFIERSSFEDKILQSEHSTIWASLPLRERVYTDSKKINWPILFKKLIKSLGVVLLLQSVTLQLISFSPSFRFVQKLMLSKGYGDRDFFYQLPDTFYKNVHNVHNTSKSTKGCYGFIQTWVFTLNVARQYCNFTWKLTQKSNVY